jgi:hypothetical protein
MEYIYHLFQLYNKHKNSKIQNSYLSKLKKTRFSADGENEWRESYEKRIKSTIVELQK